ncbi:hypothetical protein P4679_30795 [Priestia megaterium]|uniref:hypothetical protein n=1 Tax=Priestia megaterium TaxID=1404 RepID=UPI002E20231B|nr:hypothetical protein [Priestia megaterium]
MNYTDLTQEVQDSFKRDLIEVVEEEARESELYDLIKPLDIDLLEMLSDMIQEKAEESFEPWTNVAFSIDNDKFEDVVMDVLNTLSKKQPTGEEQSYFQDLSMQLGKEIIIPDDYLEFKYKFAELNLLYLQEGPATEQAVKELKKGWKKATGETLRLSKNVTSKEVEDYYILLEEIPFKTIKNIELQLTDKNIRMYHEIAVVEEGFENITKEDYELLIHFETEESSYEALYAPSHPNRTEWQVRYIAHMGKGHCSFCNETYDVDNDINDLCEELDYFEEISKPLLHYFYKTFKEKFIEQNIPVRDALRV